MFAQVAELITRPFNSVLSWFYDLLDSVSMTGFFFGTLLMFFIVSIVIMPLRGSGFHIGSVRHITHFDKSEPSSLNKFYADSSSVNYYGKWYDVR